MFFRLPQAQVNPVFSKALFGGMGDLIKKIPPYGLKNVHNLQMTLIKIEMVPLLMSPANI